MDYFDFLLNIVYFVAGIVVADILIRLDNK